MNERRTVRTIAHRTASSSRAHDTVGRTIWIVMNWTLDMQQTYQRIPF